MSYLYFSRINNLDITGHADIDFVDIPVNTDVPLFLDPERIASDHSYWGIAADKIIHDFVSALKQAIEEEDYGRLEAMLEVCREVNELHFGLSRKRPYGRGASIRILRPIADELVRYKRMLNGEISSLTELSILTPNFNDDRLSDLCANLIRPILAEFTEQQFRHWGISPADHDRPAKCWDIQRHEWIIRRIPIHTAANGVPVLLTPKSFVGTKLLLTPGEFLQKYILTRRQEDLLRSNSPLCRHKIRKSGREEILPPTKKDIVREEASKGSRKDYIRPHLACNPELLDRYRRDVYSNDENTFMTDSELDSLLYSEWECIV